MSSEIEAFIVVLAYVRLLLQFFILCIFLRVSSSRSQLVHYLFYGCFIVMRLLLLLYTINADTSSVDTIKFQKVHPLSFGCRCAVHLHMCGAVCNSSVLKKTFLPVSFSLDIVIIFVRHNFTST